MDRSDAAVLTSHFARSLAERREKIALQWYLAIASTCSLIPPRQEAVKSFSILVDQIIAFLSDTNHSKKEGWDIGKSLAKLHCLQPEAIDITGLLWADVIVEVASKEELIVIYPRLVSLFYLLATGYYEKSREIILSEQEQIRQALVFNVEKASNSLREYQLHLEEILTERTLELQAKEEQYRLITETSTLGIFQLDSSGIFLFINQAFLNIFGYSHRELIGHPFRMFIDSDDMPEMEGLKKIFDKTGKISHEFTLKHKDGHRIDTIIRAISIQLNDRRIINGFISDITDQKRMENELRASEQRYRTLAETAQDLIFLIARDGQITYINSFAADYVGFNTDQLIGQNYTMFFPKESLRSLSPAIDSVFGTSTALRLEEKIRFSSVEYWLSLSIVPLFDSSGDVTSVFILAKDISDLKKSELALQKEKKLLEKRVLQRTASLAASQDRSRKLARQVVTAQEVERRRVARELHDQAGQALISIKYEMDLMYKDLNIKSKPARQRFLKMMTLIDQTTGQIREISQNLHPPILDIAGLNLSIKEYCTELATRTSLVINYNGCELPGLPDEIGINLFRILQELLTNILKHSQATSVTVQLDYRNEVILFSVKDNGRGIDNKSSNKGLGLVGIHERVDILGGGLNIHSQAGHGTEITISIPWKSAHIHSGQPDQDPV